MAFLLVGGVFLLVMGACSAGVVDSAPTVAEATACRSVEALRSWGRHEIDLQTLHRQWEEDHRTALAALQRDHQDGDALVVERATADLLARRGSRRATADLVHVCG